MSQSFVPWLHSFNFNGNELVWRILANPKIEPASLWTVKTIKEFKGQIRKEGPDGKKHIWHLNEDILRCIEDRPW